jgi:methionine sulfoxide reductase heme-binding subunit
MHLTTSPIAWYAARAGGVVAYVLLTATVLLGMTMSSRRRVARWPRIAIEDVHRFVAFAAGTFVVVHIAAIAIDAYLPFSLQSLIVPFISRYRPAWVGFGIVAAELMLAVAITNRLRDRALSYATWRKLHYATFAVWTGATIHGLGSGTDRSTAWLVVIQAAAVGAVVGMTGWRFLQRRIRAGEDVGHLAFGGAAAGVTAVLALTLGPLHAHTKPWNAANFSDALVGRISRRDASTRGIVSLAGQGTGDQRVLVRADLLIAPAHLLSTSFQMEYLPSGDVCRGTVTQIADNGLGFDATCTLANGGERLVHASWEDSGSLDLAGGTIESQSA